MAAVGEEAGAADRERRADLVRAAGRESISAISRRQLARGGAAGVDDLAVDRGDVDAAAVEVVGDRAARGHLRVVRAHAESSILCFWLSLSARPTTRGSTSPSSGPSRVGVEHEVLVLQQRLRRAAARRRSAPSGRLDAAAGAAGWAAAASGAARPGPAPGPPAARPPAERRRRAALVAPRRRRPPRRAGARRRSRAGSWPSGRSFASSLIFATASWAASAFFASGDSAAAIFAAALPAAACSGGTAASFAASAALPPFAAASSGGTAAGGASSAGARRRGRRRHRPGARLGGAAGSVGAVLHGRSDVGRIRAAGQRAAPRDRRQVHPAEHVADRARHVVDVREHVLAELVDADALHGGGHHHAGQARLRLALVEGHHRLAGADRHLVRQLVEPRLAARARRVAPELASGTPGRRAGARSAGRRCPLRTSAISGSRAPGPPAAWRR